jgi:hypothetical protein
MLGRPFDIAPVQAGTPILAIGCDRRKKLQPRSQGPAMHVPAWQRTLDFGLYDCSSAQLMSVEISSSKRYHVPGRIL